MTLPSNLISSAAPSFTSARGIGNASNKEKRTGTPLEPQTTRAVQGAFSTDASPVVLPKGQYLDRSI